MADDVEKLHKDWEALAAEDPYWAVLSHKDKRGGGWDVEAFLETGTTQIRQLMEMLESLGVGVDRARALDFGCGVGRLVQALAGYFDSVDGVDISEQMVSSARDLNRFGDRCTYHVNVRPDLSLFSSDTFDLVHSTITLQHIPTSLALGYVSEFVRVARPGGAVVFDAPARCASRSRQLLYAVTPTWLRRARFRAKYHVASFMDMNLIPRARVEEHLAALAVELVYVEPTMAAGEAWPGFRYYARKPGTPAVS